MKEIYLKYVSEISDVVVAFVSGIAVIPIMFGTVLGYGFVIMFFAKEGVYFPWFINEIFVWSSIPLMILLLFFFISIGQSIWNEFKRYIRENVLHLEKWEKKKS